MHSQCVSVMLIEIAIGFMWGVKMDSKYKEGDKVVYLDRQEKEIKRSYGQISEIYTQEVHQGQQINKLYLINDKFVHEDLIIPHFKKGDKVYAIQKKYMFFLCEENQVYYKISKKKKILRIENGKAYFALKTKTVFFEGGDGTIDAADLVNIFATKQEAIEAFKGFKAINEKCYKEARETMMKVYNNANKVQTKGLWSNYL